jgi:hypothetical protein
VASRVLSSIGRPAIWVALAILSGCLAVRSWHLRTTGYAGQLERACTSHGAE